MSDDLKLSIILQAVDNTKAAVDAAVASIGRVEVEAKAATERAAVAMLGGYKNANEETFDQLKNAFWASKSAPKVDIVPPGAMTEINGFKSAVETLKRDFGDITKQAGGSIELDSGLAKRAAENYHAVGAAIKDAKDKAVELASAGKEAVKEAAELGGERLLGKIAAFGGALLTAGAAYKAFGWVKDAVEDAAKLGDKIDKLAAQTGLKGNELAGIKFAAEQSNTTLEAAAQAIGNLEKKMAAAAGGSKAAIKDLESIGVTAKEPLEAFKQVSEAIGKTSDPIEHARIATEAFGLKWKEIMGLLKQGPENLDSLFAAGQRYYTNANEMAENANRYKNSLGEIDTAVGSLKLQFGADLLEPISKIAAGMAAAARDGEPFKALLTGIGGAFAEFPITTSITMLVGGLAGAAGVTAAWAAAGPAVTGAIAIIQPALASLAAFVVANPITLALVGVAVAGGMVWANWDGIVGGAKAAWEDISNAVTRALGYVSTKYEEWKAAGAKFVEGLRSGITVGLKGPLGIAAKIDDAIAYIKATASQWVQIGRDIIQGLIDGVSAKAKEVVDKIRGLGSSVVREMKDLLGIKSPSKVFEDIGANVGAGMAAGIDKSTAEVKSKTEKQAKEAVAAANKGVLGAIDTATLTIKKLDTNYDKVDATVKSLASSYEKLATAVEAGDFEKMATAALGSLETVSSSAKTLKTAYEDTMKAMTGLAEKSDLLKPAIEKLNGVMPALSGWVSGLASTAWTAISGGFSTVAAAFNASIVPLMTNPIVLAIVGAAAVGTAVYVYWDDIAAAVDRAMTAITGSINGAAEVVQQTLDSWKQFGSAVVEAIRSGVADKLQGALGIKAKFDQAVKDMRSTAAEWVGVGAAMIDGLWQGIQAQMRKPLDAIKDLATKLPQWAKDLLGIKSPSRVFMAIGEQIGEGMVIGIASTEEAVRAAVEGLGEAAIYAGDEATLKFIREQEQSIRELRGEMAALGSTARATGAQARDWWGRFLPDDAAAALAATGERAADDIGRSLTDALLRGFEKGEGFADNLAETMRNLFGSMVLKPIIQPIVRSAAGLVTGALGSLLPGAAAASGGAASTGYESAIGSILSGAGSFVTGMVGEATSGIASMLGASTGVATGIGAFAAAAVPVIGAIAALAGLFGGKPSDKSANGIIDLSSGDVLERGGMTGKKAPSAETKAARDAMLGQAGAWAGVLRQLGGEIAGELRFSVGERDGLRADFGADGSKEIVDTDTERFFGRLFDAMTARATGLDAAVRTLLTTFEGTADESLNFAANLGAVNDYLRADLVGDALEQIRSAGRSAWVVWSDAGAAVHSAGAAFDGSLASAQALGASTSAMYQAELAVVGQIQGLLASTSAMFGDSIRSIEMSILDSAGRYDYLRAEIDTAYAALSSAADPQVIGDLASQINRLTMEAYGLLDQGQRADVADEYTAYLREVNTLTVERLNASQAQVEDQHAAMVGAIESAMERVAARMEAAAAAQQAAASMPVTVESRVSVAVSVDAPASVELGYA